MKAAVARDFSEVSNLMKSISKMPKPSSKLRFLLFNEGADVLSEESHSKDLGYPSASQKNSSVVLIKAVGSQKTTTRVQKQKLQITLGGNQKKPNTHRVKKTSTV